MNADPDPQPAKILQKEPSPCCLCPWPGPLPGLQGGGGGGGQRQGAHLPSATGGRGHRQEAPNMITHATIQHSTLDCRKRVQLEKKHGSVVDPETARVKEQIN